MADGILNEILRKVNQLSPTELSVLLEAGKVMQQAAAKDSLCIDSENPPDVDPGLCVEDE